MSATHESMRVCVLHIIRAEGLIDLAIVCKKTNVMLKHFTYPLILMDLAIVCDKQCDAKAHSCAHTYKHIRLINLAKVYNKQT